MNSWGGGDWQKIAMDGDNSSRGRNTSSDMTPTRRTGQRGRRGRIDKYITMKKVKEKHWCIIDTRTHSRAGVEFLSDRMWTESKQDNASFIL